MKNILVTGSAGFIGMHSCLALIKSGYHVTGVDNINNYYDQKLKISRINKIKQNDNFEFIKGDISNLNEISNIFKKNKFDVVLHLAAQAGVRYSLENPFTYVDNNIKGFINMLECLKNNNIKKFIYASSSSVYGGNSVLPFKEIHNVDKPLNLYAVTKKTNELMAYTYSNLYNISSIGVRFFTAYGPWGRPDMALSIFASSILAEKPIDVHNHGQMIRDFTYIDDIISGTVGIIDNIDKIFSKKNEYPVPHEVFNLGNGKSETLLNYIECLEQSLNKKAIINFLPLQMGEMIETSADTSKIKSKINYTSNTKIEVGVEKFSSWYLDYYSQNK